MIRLRLTSDQVRAEVYSAKFNLSNYQAVGQISDVRAICGIEFAPDAAAPEGGTTIGAFMFNERVLN